MEEPDQAPATPYCGHCSYHVLTRPSFFTRWPILGFVFHSLLFMPMFIFYFLDRRIITPP